MYGLVSSHFNVHVLHESQYVRGWGGDGGGGKGERGEGGRSADLYACVISRLTVNACTPTLGQIRLTNIKMSLSILLILLV